MRRPGSWSPGQGRRALNDRDFRVALTDELLDEIFKGTYPAVGMFDRLWHHSDTVVTSADSYRMKQARVTGGTRIKVN